MCRNTFFLHLKLRAKNQSDYYFGMEGVSLYITLDIVKLSVYLIGSTSYILGNFGYFFLINDLQGPNEFYFALASCFYYFSSISALSRP